ncbi:MAG: hypothetical protein A2Y14_01220 [Verrucomicrobia bacterium GWF2_51_19]|nr:MAG: hypothetical protein A2Y14_01220 [Verrucomicrobia bacterium GWF2_51_19]HCJ12204.1 3-phytase [Opitutae bacterium]
MKTLTLLCAVLLLTACSEKRTEQTFYKVSASAETRHDARLDDKVDDPAIWVHPQEASKSLLFFSFKGKKGSGIEVCDIDGAQLQFVPAERVNNIDVRCGLLVNGEKVDFLAASHSEQAAVSLYKIDAKTRQLEPLALQLPVTVPTYGICLYHNRREGRFFVIVTSHEGACEQWEIKSDKARVFMEKARAIKIDSICEGCVADDEHERLYISEETKGIWRYNANPEAGQERVMIAKAGEHLAPDIEGLTVYDASKGEGYLIASSQGDSSYAVFERAGDNRHIGNFQIVPGVVEGTQCTDGIDVCSSPLGPKYPHGVFIAHDDQRRNNRGSNFKIVPWERIAEAMQLKMRP